MTKFREILGNAKVFYRIYPSENPDWENFRFLGDGKTIQLHHVGPQIKENPGEKIFKQFESDGFLYNRSQEEIYSVVMEGVIQSVFEGQHAIIVAFGQTGSGKSLTIAGLHYFYKDRGLIPRTIENIFRLKDTLPKNLQMTIHISYIEVLSTFQSKDLLRPYPSPVDKNDIHKRLRKVEVRSDLQTLQHIYKAEGRKEYTSDTKHPSHAGSSILTFEFTVRDMNFSEPHEFTSKLHIIDLAGNDCFGDKSSIFKKYSQVGSANSTKSFMEHFMILLCGNDPELTRVKMRTNVVSQYLGETFNRGSILRFIGHLKTSKDDHNISLSLLKFGQLLKTMESDCCTIVLKENELMKFTIMEEKLNDLYKERLILQMLGNQEPRAVCPEKYEHMRRMVEDFVHNKIDGTHLLKMGEIFTILKIMKDDITNHEQNAMINRPNIMENLEPSINSELRTSIQAVPISKGKNTQKLDIGPTQSTVSQPTSTKDTQKTVKKTSSQTKSKKESIEMDNRSISKKNKVSSSSLNGTNKRSSTLGKKKVGAAVESSASTDKASKKAMSENYQNSALLSTVNLLLPEVLPEQKETLKEYIQNPKTNYKTLLETFKKHENEAKIIYQNYLKELKKLDTYFEILDLRKNEVVQTKLVTQFSRKQEKDSEGNIIKSELEERCQKNLKKAESDVAAQQETVLNIQAEFKIALSMRQEIKNDVKEEFDEYCKEKYNTSVQNLEDSNEFVLENEIKIEEFCERVAIEDEVPMGISQETVFEEIYKNLKEIMMVEARKKAQYLKKSIRWLENTRF